MLHERVDDLPSRGDSSTEADLEEMEVGLLSLPKDIALLERLRASAYATLPTLSRVPTDVFVWQAGEPTQREVTKIAGLPYRPARRPWPQSPSGEPLTFVAQFCFADSRDLVPALPGDVLLIFATGEFFATGEQDPHPRRHFELLWGAGLTFEWTALGDGPLVEATDLPPTPWPVQPCSGMIQRLWDYRGVPARVSMDVPAVVEGTKIGGICPWLDEPDYVRFDQEAHTPGAPGIYLCTLASVDPEVYVARPDLPRDFLVAPSSDDPAAVRTWRQAQLAETDVWCSHALMIADVGLLNFFLAEGGRISWTAHCQT